MLATRPEVASDAARGSAVITLGMGLSALTLGGVSANHLDVAPRHAGVVFAAGNTAATLAGLLSVPLTGILLDSTDSWTLVFGVAAAHYMLGAMAWVSWSGGEVLEEDIFLA
jgi:ACS family sodium-dependent inorganic phosphate cotransporter